MVTRQILVLKFWVRVPIAQQYVGVGRTDFTREQIDFQVAKALGIDSQREGITILNIIVVLVHLTRN